jgi:hypothetical protein
VPGSKHPDDYILYTAHWDHLGIKPDVAGPDKIYNGAIDNGMGVSSILELGEAFAHDKPPPSARSPSSAGRWRSRGCSARSISESTRLAAVAYRRWRQSRRQPGGGAGARHGPGRQRRVGDGGHPGRRAEDAEPCDLTRSRARKGHFYRSDHISLAKVGVPMLDPDGGFDLDPGRQVAAGQAVRDDYLHTTTTSRPTNSTRNGTCPGPVEDLKVLYAFGETLANSDQWPNWYKGNEFRAIREWSPRRW